MVELALHTQIQELRERCTDLRDALKDVALKYHTVTMDERPRLLELYDRLFGELESKRQQLALEAAEIFRRVELLTIKVSRGENLTQEVIDLINMVVDKEYEKFKQRVKDSLNTSAIGRENNARKKVADASEDDLVSMYRTLAKQLHPDSASETEDSIAAWHSVQEAYQERNAERLRTLLMMYSNDNQASPSESWTLERWQREERELSARLRLDKRSLNRVLSQEPLIIAKELEDDAWIARHRDELLTDIIARKNEIDTNVHRYEELTGGGPAPVAKTETEKEAERFEEDFIENTYFGGR